MRTAALLLATAAVLVPAVPASAGRFTFGISIARRDDRDSRSPGVFAELRVVRRLSLRVEMSHDTTSGVPDGATTTQRLGGAAIVDLGHGGRISPFVLAGLGTERARSTWGQSDARERELGAGLRATVASDLVISIDARIGQIRPVDQPVIQNQPGVGFDPIAPSSWTEYRSLRIGVGINF